MKERLTGAIILVALIVLLVPELLTGPIRRKSAPAVSSTAASSLAAAPAGRTANTEPPLRSYTLTLGGQRPAHDVLATPAAQAPDPKGRSPAGAGQSPPESSQASSAQLPGVSQTATSHQYASHVSQQGVGDGSSGLQASRSPAHTAVREARSSGSSGGWVVQLGSFASRRNADHLAGTLRRKGFRMAVSPGRAGSRVLWRVRAGPARDRASALHLAARLRALGHRGELIPLR